MYLGFLFDLPGKPSWVPALVVGSFYGKELKISAKKVYM